MRQFILKVAQNGGEYYGYTTIIGKELKRGDGYNTVYVDGVEIRFDEYIDKIIEKDIEEE